MVWLTHGNRALGAQPCGAAGTIQAVVGHGLHHELDGLRVNRGRNSDLVQALGYPASKSGFLVYCRSVFDTVRDFMQDKVLARCLKPDLMIIDNTGMKQLPPESGEFLSRPRHLAR